MHNSSSTGSSHWLSFAVHEGTPSISHEFNLFPASLCMISVVLDSSARNDFSGIRVLVVRQRSVEYTKEPLALEDCADLGIDLTLVTPNISYRARLAHRHSRKRSALTLANTTRGLATIIFEAVLKVKDSASLIRLIPYSNSLNTSYQEVLYDRTHHIDPANPATLMFLESRQTYNHFSNVPKYLRQPDSDSPGIPSYSVRVLRVCDTSSQLSDRLGHRSSIIRLIVSFAVGRKGRGWRKALLSYGLVSKSWVHVLDLFFALLDGTGDDKSPNILSVARAIKANPERGTLLRVLDHRDFGMMRPGQYPSLRRGDSEAWEAFLTILEFATSVAKVNLCAVPDVFVDRLATSISKLPRVSCHFAYPQATQVTKIISKCKNLYKLTVLDWAEPYKPLPSNHLLCRMEELDINSGTINGPQLLLFTSPSPGQRSNLSRLSLVRVHNILNNEFRILLKLTAHSLVHLFLLDCWMDCEPPDEEKALDGAISDMTALESLYADGRHLSILTLTRKRSLIPGTLKPGHIPQGKIGIRDARYDSMSIEQVRAAAKVMQWQNVCISWRDRDRDETEWDQSLVDEAVGIALKRGVYLSLVN